MEGSSIYLLNDRLFRTWPLLSFHSVTKFSILSPLNAWPKLGFISKTKTIARKLAENIVQNLIADKANRRNSFRILFLYLIWDSNHGFSSKKPTHCLLNHGEFNCTSQQKKIFSIFSNRFFFSCITTTDQIRCGNKEHIESTLIRWLPRQFSVNLLNIGNLIFSLKWVRDNS